MQYACLLVELVDERLVVVSFLFELLYLLRHILHLEREVAELGAERSNETKLRTDTLLLDCHVCFADPLRYLIGQSNLPKDAACARPSSMMLCKESRCGRVFLEVHVYEMIEKH